MAELTHTDESGRAIMVDTGYKPVQRRTAVATGRINMKPETIKLISEHMMKKGDAITVAEIAGIQAAKECSRLIPLCHNIPIDKVGVTLTPDECGITATGTVTCTGRTGVEMEALTSVSIALLTVYDMCKSADKTMTITDIRLVKKEKHDVT